MLAAQQWNTIAARIPDERLSIEQCIKWLSNTKRSPASMSTGCWLDMSWSTISMYPWLALGRLSGTWVWTGSVWLPARMCRQPFSSVASVTASHSPTMGRGGSNGK